MPYHQTEDNIVGINREGWTRQAHQTSPSSFSIYLYFSSSPVQLKVNTMQQMTEFIYVRSKQLRSILLVLIITTFEF